MEENKIDFKEWTVPTKWENLTLKQFQEIERETEGKEKVDILSILHILCNKEKDDVLSLPMEFVDMILAKLSFILTPMPPSEPSNKITIGKDTYIINTMNKLKTGEYVALNTVIKSDDKNYAAMLAILCRKEGEIYDSKFENEVFEERMKMFENMPVTKMMPLCAFFLQLSAVLEAPSQLYSMVKEIGNHTLKDIETSEKIGALKRRYYRWQVTRLLKRLNSNKPM